MADPVYGKDVRLWAGQGATSISFAEALGNYTLSHDVSISGPHALADGKQGQRVYPVPGTDVWRLDFGRYLVLDEGNARRLYEWFMGLGVSSVGNLLVDFSGTTAAADECVYFREPVKGSATLALPVADLADLTGAISAALAMPGTVGDEAEIGRVDADSLSAAAMPDSAAVTIASTNDYVVILTDVRAGTTRFRMSYKRGAAAWTNASLTNAVVDACQSNAVVEALAISDTLLQVGDLLRLEYSPLPADGNRWKGNLVIASEVSF